MHEIADNRPRSSSTSIGDAGPNAILGRLHHARRDLLDLGLRNRLLNVPRRAGQTRSVTVVGEEADEVFRVLFRDRRPMSFLPGRDEGVQDEPPDDDDAARLPADRMEGEADGRGESQPDTATKLKTMLAPEGLQRRLLDISRDAATLEEEQGVNVLFLALGILNWFESDAAAEPRRAPLFLLPVELARENDRRGFRLKVRDEDLSANLSLQAKLDTEFGVKLPDLPDADDWLPSDYFAEVERAIESQARWSIDPNAIVLGFFSFAKLLMYRDLDAETWPEPAALLEHPLIEGLLGAGFGDTAIIPDEASIDIDSVIDPADMVHILDADSSQTIAINDVRGGRNLVVQGPPGTGKSQTIANMIASAVQQGKTVLFVAEKMAALEVVHERLQRCGLGDICLELHSRHANKKAVLEELRRTLSADPPVAPSTVEIDRLREARDRLNAQARRMHTGVGTAKMTPFRAVGRLVRLAGDGIAPPDFSLDRATELSGEQVHGMEAGLEDLATRIREAGVPARHPWRGAQSRAILPADMQRLAPDLAALPGLVDTVIARSADAALVLRADVPTATLLAASDAIDALIRLARAPTKAVSRLGDSVWGEGLRRVEALVEIGVRFARIRSQIEPQTIVAIWSTDMSVIRREIAVNGRSIFRLFKGRYRVALAEFRTLLKAEMPKGQAARLAIVDQMIEAQAGRREIERNQTLGEAAFGSDWHGLESDWPALSAATKWMREATDAGRAHLGGIAACGPDASQLTAKARDLAAAVKDTAEAADRITKMVEIDLPESFETSSLGGVPLSVLEARAIAWRDEASRVHEWTAISARIADLRATPAAPIVDRLYDGRIGYDRARDVFRYAFAEAIWRDAAKRDPLLADLDRMSHEAALAEFRNLDRARIRLAVQEAARVHYDSLPRGGAGELGVVREELNKKRRHLPIRKLMERAGSAIQRIKPVFLMSPLSVAQFLPAGRQSFDLLLIDEASQIQPVDALGAVARAKQMVVVGDRKQLPPTNFFRRIVSDEERPDEEEVHAAAGDMESILTLCAARGLPDRMLRWHYRSRHPSLIAVSNKTFYGNRLHLPPSPFESSEAIGLRLEKVERGGYDRGGSARNMTEARRIADAVLDHARRHPNLSLGVGAFSVNQRDAILDALEERRDESASFQDFFAVDRAERFFVKNLENIQGDERDVIFLSIGYGPDVSGYMAMNFGPVSADGGDRRLNVLISRARQRCEVFSTITADDIDLNRGRSLGVAALKTFLAYAEHGRLEIGQPTDRDFDSDFEEAVARALMSLGYEVRPQIGVSGFFIDLAVVDSDRPGRYVLGIECDGATYHSSRSARDRDRLRQEVLELQGWRIHRIWSTDWFKRPDDELRRAVAAIEMARSAESGEATPANRGVLPESTAKVERTPAIEIDNGLTAAPYVEASFPIAGRTAPHEVPITVMSDVVRRVVEIEGPIHTEEVGRRIARLWNLQRAGSRIQAAVLSGLEHAAQAGLLFCDGIFWSSKGKAEAPPRDRSNVRALDLRKPEMLPLAEIRSAILLVAGHHVGIDRENVAIEIARLLGFKSTSRQLRDAFEPEIEHSIANGTLEERDGRLYRARQPGSP